MTTGRVKELEDFANDFKSRLKSSEEELIEVNKKNNEIKKRSQSISPSNKSKTINNIQGKTFVFI